MFECTVINGHYSSVHTVLWLILTTKKANRGCVTVRAFTVRKAQRCVCSERVCSRTGQNEEAAIAQRDRQEHVSHVAAHWRDRVGHHRRRAARTRSAPESIYSLYSINNGGVECVQRWNVGARAPELEELRREVVEHVGESGRHPPARSNTASHMPDVNSEQWTMNSEHSLCACARVRVCTTEHTTHRLYSAVSTM